MENFLPETVFTSQLMIPLASIALLLVIIILLILKSRVVLQRLFPVKLLKRSKIYLHTIHEELSTALSEAKPMPDMHNRFLSITPPEFFSETQKRELVNLREQIKLAVSLDSSLFSQKKLYILCRAPGLSKEIRMLEKLALSTIEAQLELRSFSKQAKDEAELPFFISWSTLKESIEQDHARTNSATPYKSIASCALFDCLQSKLPKKGAEKISPSFLKECVERGRCVIFISGVELQRDKEALLRSLFKQLEFFASNRIILDLQLSAMGITNYSFLKDILRQECFENDTIKRQLSSRLFIHLWLGMAMFHAVSYDEQLRDLKMLDRDSSFDWENQFIPLKACVYTPRRKNDTEKAYDDYVSRNTTIDTEAIFSYSSFIMILGEAGSGKTTLLTKCMLSLLATPEKKLHNGTLPFYIPLVQLQDLLDQLSRRDSVSSDSARTNIHEYSLIDCLILLLEKQYREHAEEFGKHAKRFVEYCVKQGLAVIFLDGFDEVISEPTEPAKPIKNIEPWLTKQVVEFQKTWPGNRIMLSSRIIVSLDRLFSKFPHVLEMASFDLRDIKECVEFWFKNDVEKGDELFETLTDDKTLQHIATNPLLLSAIVIVHKEGWYPLPDSRKQLYENCIKILLYEWDEKREVRRSPFDYDLIFSVLERLALELHYKDERLFSLDILQALLEKISEHPDTKLQMHDVDGMVRYLIDHSAMFCQVTENSYRFRHMAFKDFLAASAIVKEYAKDQDKLGQLITNAFNSRWEEVIILAAGILERHVNDLFSGLLKEYQNVLSTSSKLTLLLGQCLKTIETKYYDSWLDDNILDKIYALLIHLARPWEGEPILFEQLQERQERRQANELLKELGHEKIVERLERRLYGPKPVDDLPLVIKSLGRLGGSSKAAFLLGTLQRTELGIEERRAVLEVFAEIKPVELRLQLTAYLQKVEPELLGDLAVALAEIGAEKSIPQLVKFLKTSSNENRLKILHALGIFGETVSGVILETGSNENRLKILHALGILGEAASGVIKDLEALYAETDPSFQQALTVCLQKITGADAQTTFATEIREKSFFAERTQEIREVETLFGSTRIINLYGMPGIGKTTLSKLLGSRHKKSGKPVLFIHFASSDSNTILSLQGKLSAALSIRKSSRFLGVLDYLDSHETLICIENLETLISDTNWPTSDARDFLQTLIGRARRTRKTSILLISRNPLHVDFAQPEPFQVFQVPELSLGDMSEILKAAKLGNFQERDDSKLLKSMYDIYIGGNPAFLLLFVKWITFQNQKETFIKRYERQEDPFRSFFEWKETVTFLRDHFVGKLSADATTALKILSLSRVPFNIKDRSLEALLKDEGLENCKDMFQELLSGSIILIKYKASSSAVIAPLVRWFFFYRLDFQRKKIIHQKLSEYFERISLFFEAVYHREQAGNVREAAQLVVEHIDGILAGEPCSSVIQWLNLISDKKLDAINRIRVNRNLASLLRLQGDYKDAETTYHAILSVYQNNHDQAGMIRVANERAELLLEQGYVVNAKTQLMEAKSRFSACDTDLSDLRVRVECNDLYASLLRGKSVSSPHWRENDLMPVTRAHIKMLALRISLVENEKEEAIDQIVQLQKLLEDLALIDRLPVQHCIAEALQLCGRFNEADRVIQDTLKTILRLGLTSYDAYFLRLRGLLESEKEDSLDQALNSIETSIEILKPPWLDNPRHLAKSHLALANVLKKSGVLANNVLKKSGVLANSERVEKCMKNVKSYTDMIQFDKTFVDKLL